MGDQRVEARPALGLEDARDRARVGGVGAQAVDRLGRKRHELAAPQRLGRGGDGLGRWLHDRHLTDLTFGWLCAGIGRASA